jgi:hypothetical protein
MPGAAPSAIPAIEDPSYPLGQEWLENPLTSPRIGGGADFGKGVSQAASDLIEGGFVALRFYCLSSFVVTICAPQRQLLSHFDALPDDFLLVSASCGSRGGSAPLSLLGASPAYTAEKLHLLHDDARAVTYLLRAIGRSLAHHKAQRLAAEGFSPSQAA